MTKPAQLRSAALLAASVACLAVCGCQPSAGGTRADSTPAGAPTSSVTKSPLPTPEQSGDETPADPAPTAEASAPAPRTVESGLDVGMKFAAFEVTNVATDETYCQVCRFGSSPKIMIVGTLDDSEFEEDLKDIEALLARHRPYGAKAADDAVKAFAVVATAGEDGLEVPEKDRGDLIAAANRMRRRLELDMPVVVPNVESEPAMPGGVFEGHYAVKSGRTIMYADPKNEVRYSAVAPSHLRELDELIAAASAKTP